MKFTDFKISIEKSWGFTYQVLVLIILGIAVIAGFLVLIWQLLKAPPPPPEVPISTPVPETNAQIPEGPIYGIWGTVASINEQPERADDGTGVKIIATIGVRGDLGKDYNFQISEDTLINKYALGTIDSPPKILEKNIDWWAIKLNGRVYVETQIDLLKIITVPPSNIKSFDVYITPSI